MCEYSGYFSNKEFPNYYNIYKGHSMGTKNGVHPAISDVDKSVSPGRYQC